MYTSKKPAIYIVDGLNFIRSFLIQNRNLNEETLTTELIAWLNDLGTGEMYGSEFRVILDGSFRNIGPTRTACVSATFTEEYCADEIIFEQAHFLHAQGERVIVISSDLGLTDSIRALGVKTMGCSKFFSTFYQ